MKKYIFGVDIGGTTIKIGLFDINGALLEKHEIPTIKSNNGKGIPKDIANYILGIINERNFLHSEILGIGAGVPCGHDKDGNVEIAANIGWTKFNPRIELENELKMPVILKKDSYMAALGEMSFGSGKDYSDMVIITLGTGVGSGIILDRKVLTSVNGGVGEIGHINVNCNEKEVCGCKNKGCLEQYASATGIVNIAKRLLKNTDKESILNNVEITAKAVFDAVKQNDSVAIEAATEFGVYLGKGLAYVSAIVNPEVFIIGGGVSNAGDILFKYIIPTFSDFAPGINKNTKFILASLGNDAGIYGAFQAVKNELIEK